MSKKDLSVGQWKSQTSYFGVKLPGIANSSRRSQVRSITKSAPPTCCKISSEHAIRRHMQNDLRKYAFTTNEKSGNNIQKVSW